MLDQEKQNVLGEEHLKLLRIGYIVSGSTNVFFALMPLIYVAFGLGTALSGFPQPLIGVFMVVFGMVVSLFLITLAVLQFLAARALGQRRSRLLCQIAAGASCLQMPWGVLLGVFTFMVLGRESVSQMFESDRSQLMPAPLERYRPFSTVTKRVPVRKLNVFLKDRLPRLIPRALNVPNRSVVRALSRIVGPLANAVGTIRAAPMTTHIKFFCA
jgi:hypothetical protein